MRPDDPRLAVWACEVRATAGDAYSFGYYGARAWSACFVVLAQRGYNSTEASAIMRSKIARLAADDRREADGPATAADLARFLDTVDAPQLRGLVDDYVIGIYLEAEPPIARSAPALRLVYSRRNAPRATTAEAGS